jgi:large subunit ribosomal protein L53
MISNFITTVSAKFNPFTRSQRMPRIFLSMLPPTARTSMKISVAQLPRESAENGSLSLTFSTYLKIRVDGCKVCREQKDWCAVEDGKEMSFDPETIKIKDVVAEVDRHSRMLARKEDLTSGWGEAKDLERA